MEIKTFRKTATVRAVQYLDELQRVSDIIYWAASNGVTIVLVHKDEPGGVVTSLKIPTLEGDMEAPVGSYVCQGKEDEFWFVKQSIFESTYEEVKQWGIKALWSRLLGWFQR